MRTAVSPKAHGAWLGGGIGTFVGSVVIGIIQSYVTHKALPLSMQTLIEGICGPVVAFVGAYIMPLVNSGGNTPSPAPAPNPPSPPEPGPVVSPTPVAPSGPMPVESWGQIVATPASTANVTVAQPVSIWESQT